MNSEIANILKDKIDGLPFVDRIAGLVTTLTLSEETEAGKKRKTFPVACNVSQADCMAGRYQDLVPDTAKKSVLYFEEVEGAQMTGMEGNKMNFRSTLILVGWLNLKKMGLTDCGWSSTAVLQIIRELSAYMQPSNHGNKFIHFKVTGISQAKKTSAVFSKYTYDEAVTQYLIYPYDYFAVNIAFEFSINKNCIQDAEIPDIEICDENTGEIENPTPSVGECWDLLRWNCDTNMWVRWHTPTTPGVYNITVNEDGSLTFTEDTGGGEGGTLTCENIDECETIQDIVTSVEELSDDLAQEILDRAAADDALQDAIDEKQDALGYTAENVANKTDVMAGNTTSSVKYLSAKGVYDWVISLGYQVALTAANFGAFINALTSKPTPVDADMLSLMDSADSNNAKKVSWANLKATLKTYFDTIYQSVSSVTYKSTTDHSVTGVITETVLHTEPIPAGTVSVGDVITAYLRFTKTGTAGTLIAKAYINTTPAIGGSNFFAPTTFASTILYVSSNKFGLVKSTTQTQFANANVNNDLGLGGSGGTLSNFNIDWSVDQYIVFTATISNTADVGTLGGYLIEIK